MIIFLSLGEGFPRDRKTGTEGRDDKVIVKQEGKSEHRTGGPKASKASSLKIDLITTLWFEGIKKP